MSRIDELANSYARHISAPWQANLTGAERTVFLVYPQSDERKVRARLGLFEEATIRARHRWVGFDLTPLFGEWFSTLDSEHQAVLFQEPESFHLEMDLDVHGDSSFTRFAAVRLLEVLEGEVDDSTVLAILGAGSLYGFSRLSTILDRVRHLVRGRLLVFFPGSHDGNHYRLLDARDGANYLAVPITPFNGAFES
jgi:hypothetical protein